MACACSKPLEKFTIHTDSFGQSANSFQVFINIPLKTVVKAEVLSVNLGSNVLTAVSNVAYVIIDELTSRYNDKTLPNVHISLNNESDPYKDLHTVNQRFIGLTSNMVQSNTVITVAQQTYAVTVSNPGGGNVYFLDGVNRPALTLRRGGVYTFNQSDASNSGHPISFKNVGGSAYTTGVVTTGTPGSNGQTVFTVPQDAPAQLLYYCTVHGDSMGSTITTTDLSNVITFTETSNIYNVPQTGFASNVQSEIVTTNHPLTTSNISNMQRALLKVDLDQTANDRSVFYVNNTHCTDTDYVYPIQQLEKLTISIYDERGIPITTSGPTYMTLRFHCARDNIYRY